MSKKILVLCASLVGGCFAEDAPEVTESPVEQVVTETTEEQIVPEVPAEQPNTVVVEEEAREVTEEHAVSAPEAEQSPSDVSPEQPTSSNSGASTESAQVDVQVPEVHELPGIRIEQGPVVVEPSYGCSEENVEALAHATVQALHATLSDVAATVNPASAEKIEKAEKEVTEAVSAVGNVIQEVTEAVSAVQDVITDGSIVTEYVPAIIDFISSYYNWFVEFFKQGWKYMVYNSVNRATRHIVITAGHRSPIVDLSALAQVDKFAVECFGKMHDAKMAILEAAAQRSPQMGEAAKLYLEQYENWFKGNADVFVDLDATRAMLECLGVKNVESSAFTQRNLQHFRDLGGDIRHSNLFLIVAPGEISKYEATPIAERSPVAEVEQAPETAVEAAEVAETAVAGEEQISAVSTDIAEHVVDEILANEIIQGVTNALQPAN